MFCNNCGKVVVEGARFCDNCGTYIQESTDFGNPKTSKVDQNNSFANETIANNSFGKEKMTSAQPSGFTNQPTPQPQPQVQPYNAQPQPQPQVQPYNPQLQPQPQVQPYNPQPQPNNQALPNNNLPRTGQPVYGFNPNSQGYNNQNSNQSGQAYGNQNQQAYGNQNQQAYGNQNQQAYGAVPPPVPPVRKEKDDPSNWTILGFILAFFVTPLIGLILYIVWKPDYPLKAQAVGKGTLIGFLIRLGLMLIFFVAQVAIFSAL